MSYDYSKLLGKIKEIYSTQKDFAKALGINRCSLNLKVNNKAEFTQTEINKSIRLLGIDETEIPAYFFTEKIEKTQQNTLINNKAG